MNTITIDIKTRSCASIKTHGIFVYAQNKSTQVICVTVKKNSEPPVVWLPPELRRQEIVSISDDRLRQMLEEAELIQAYDITTEFALWKYTLCRLYPWFPEVPIKKLSCIAARAAYLGMGYSRHDLFLQLNGNTPESSRGKVKKKFVPNQHLSEEELDAFISDCKKATEFESSLADLFLELPPFEQNIWRAGLLMNDKGIFISRDLLDAKIAEDEQEIDDLNDEFKAVTGIKNPMNDLAFTEYVRAHGVSLKSLAEEDVKKTFLALPEGIFRRMLEIRCRIAQIRHFDGKKILPMLNHDSRIQGLWEYYGTSAGEWNLKYLVGVEALDEIARYSGDGMLYIVDFPELKSIVLTWLLDNEFVPPGRYAHCLLESCKSAVRKPGNTLHCGRIKISCFSRFLKFMLPSGRDIFLYDPKLGKKQELRCQVRCGRQMMEKQMTGGYLLALIESAISRDILMSSVLNLIENGISPVLMTEDEILIDDDSDKDLFDDLDLVLEERPKWCEDIPYRAVPYLGAVWRKKPDKAGI